MHSVSERPIPTSPGSEARDANPPVQADGRAAPADEIPQKPAVSAGDAAMREGRGETAFAEAMREAGKAAVVQSLWALELREALPGDLGLPKTANTASTQAAPATQIPEQSNLRQLTADVRGLIVRLVETGGSEARLSLEPPELGSVHVRVVEHDGALRLMFEVQSRAVRDALVANQSQLSGALGEQGLELTNFTVDVRTGRGDGQFTGSGSPTPHRADTEDTARDAKADVTTDDRQHRPVREHGRLDVVA